MTSESLREARKFEEIFEKFITPEERPAFHLTPRVGWMNDPNGFSIYNGQYHMFYQYHPYDSQWGPMHWGHAVSEDLLHWKHLPAALAPDTYYDMDGVFSGSAITMKDGKQLLIYTGVRRTMTEDGKRKELQTQCLAIGDGLDYEKLDCNPVIPADMIPEGGSKYDFRDPKVIEKPDGTYRMFVANRPADGSGQILLYKSEDAIHWEFVKVFAENKNRYGLMWECPDFFELDGKGILLTSPQDMFPQGFEYHNGNGTICLVGNYDDETETFAEENNHAVDYGIDFYAMQTVLAEDGRRIMMGWLQNWDTCFARLPEDRWFGQMSVPRELSVRDNRLYQWPIRELEAYRKNKVEYKDYLLKGCGIIAQDQSVDEIKERGIKLDGIKGRMIDLEVTVSRAYADKFYNKFTICLAANDVNHTDISFRPKERVVKIDRKFSGSRRAVIHQRRAQIDSYDGTLKMRIIMDRFSMEVFINDGRQVMSATLRTDVKADQIYFLTDKDVKLDVTKYDLVFE